MPEYVSGWHDEKNVYLVERNGDQVRARRVPAKWSAFVLGLDDEDRRTLQRTRGVVALQVEPTGYTRIDFATRWDRTDITRRISAVASGQTLGYDDGIERGVYEADVNPLRRLLSDIPTINVSGTFRLGWFDLETDSRKSFDDARNGRARILSWALCSSDRSYSRVEVLAADTDEAERAMLKSFFEAAEQFDVLLAWNGDGFDFPVLEMRMQRLRVQLSSGRMPFWQRWCWLDAMQVFKKYNQAHDSGEERASFSLNSIAHHTLGEGKDAFDASKTWEAWEAGGDERERMARYNMRDTELLPMIEDKTGFVALHLAVCQVTRCFPDSASLGAAQQGDGFLLALGAKQGYRFASKRYEEREEGAFAGAYVMTPKRLGLVDNVHVCDFAGLYPSIMRSFNMSPDTLLYPNDARAEGAPAHCKLPERNTYFRTDRRGIFPLALDQLVAQRAEYTRRADAAEPGSEEWNRYKRLSSAFKIIANSFYGIIGSPFTRYFDRSIAEGVTQTGAWLIKHVARTSEAAGLEPFYGDTDSVFVSGDADRFARVVDSLNESWPATLADMGCTESRIKLEFEKSFRKLVIVSAKRYAARFAVYKGKPAPPDMKPEVKGLEYKRGDALRLAREMQAEAIGMLLRDDPLDVGAFREFVSRWRTRVLDGELAIEDVVLSQSVKGLDEYALRYTSARCGTKHGTGKNAKACGFDFGHTHVGMGSGEWHGVRGIEKCPRCGTERKIASQPAHVRVARVLQERGEPIVAGTRIEYLVVRPGPDDVDDGKLLAVPARDPGMLERIDRSYYWEDRILAPTKRVLEAVFPTVEWGEPKPVREPSAPKPGRTKRAGTLAKNGTLELFARGQEE